MKMRIINAPTPETLAMLRRRMPSEFRTRLDLLRVDAVALLMLPVPDLYFCADLASKGADVMVSEIFGSCPQHITSLAIFGEIAAVAEAMRLIEQHLGA